MRNHHGKNLLTFAAATLLAGTVALAQQYPGGQQPNPPGQQAPPGQQMPGQQPTPGGNPGYPSSAGEGAPGTNGSMRSFADKSFIKTTLSTSAAEAQMSQLATQKSPSKDVKNYGQKMIQIHSQLAHQLKPVAQMMGVSANQKPTKKERKEIAHLKKLNGKAFDHAYIKAMAKHQKHVVKSFKTEESAANSPTIKQAAKMDEPVLSEHLQVLEQIAQNHNVQIGKK